MIASPCLGFNWFDLDYKLSAFCLEYPFSNPLKIYNPFSEKAIPDELDRTLSVFI
jgi:hypothetical protein